MTYTAPLQGGSMLAVRYICRIHFRMQVMGFKTGSHLIVYTLTLAVHST